MLGKFKDVLVVVAFGFAASIGPALAAQAKNSADKVSFNQDVRPILSNHCFACHGPDESKRDSGVRLDVADEADLDELVNRIISEDADEIMPPPATHKKLSPAQIETLKQWVKQGGQYAEHWSFVAPKKHTVPESRTDWSDRPIDRFVEHSLKASGQTPSLPTDKRTLIRRVTFDLTGLPPTMDQIQTFLDDNSGDAYEKLIDRLIGTPSYGEHMARYWLDLVRFADTNGMHHDHYRDMTPYRDWVIRSFNENLRFDNFIKYQIAGDLYGDPNNDQLIASGFNRLHLIIDVGTALPEDSFNKNVVDRVTAVGTAFMGLTVQCAACHDHKYDPITQKEFYQLYAFFNNFDGKPETGGRNSIDFKRGLQPPYLNLMSESQENELRVLAGDVSRLKTEVVALQKAEAKAKRLKAEKAAEKAKKEAEKLTGQAAEKKDDGGQGETKDAPKPSNAKPSNAKPNNTKATKKKNPAKKKKPEQSPELMDLIAKRDAAQKKHDNFLLTIPAALVMKERNEVRPTFVLERGEYDHPGEKIQRNTPAFLPPLEASSNSENAGGDKTKTRMDLAKWLVEKSNPLTARVTVNRFWQQFFGTGLVRTSEDFGAQGEVPSHPELLDHLAVKFVDSGWDVKQLVRAIVLSETYQQTSRATRERFISDPANRMLARGSRFRLDAEVIRDQILSVTGLLNEEMQGKSVKPPQPPGLWKLVAMPSSFPNVYRPDKGEKIYRRSVYTFWKRGLPPPQMTIFDAPSRESCIARRERTNTPLQALLLMNEEQYFQAAMYYAKTRIDDGLDDGQRIRFIYQLVTSTSPAEKVTGQLLEALSGFRKIYENEPELAKAMLAKAMPEKDSGKAVKTIDDPKEQVELAAWTMIVHSLLNLDTTKTRE